MASNLLEAKQDVVTHLAMTSDSKQKRKLNRNANNYCYKLKNAAIHTKNRNGTRTSVLV